MYYNYDEITPILLNELPLPFVNDLKCSSFALDFFLIYAKMTLTQFLAEIYFPLQMIVL